MLKGLLIGIVVGGVLVVALWLFIESRTKKKEDIVLPQPKKPKEETKEAFNTRIRKNLAKFKAERRAQGWTPKHKAIAKTGRLRAWLKDTEADAKEEDE